MKSYYRIMSVEEFFKYLDGDHLVATQKPNTEITDATEPVFFFADSLIDLAFFQRNGDLLCEFELDETNVKKGNGKIRVFDESNYSELAGPITAQITEYYAKMYNDKMFKLKRFSFLDISDEKRALLEHYFPDVIKLKSEILGNIYIDTQKRVNFTIQELGHDNDGYPFIDWSNLYSQGEEYLVRTIFELDDTINEIVNAVIDHKDGKKKMDIGEFTRCCNLIDGSLWEEDYIPGEIEEIEALIEKLCCIEEKLSKEHRDELKENAILNDEIKNKLNLKEIKDMVDNIAVFLEEYMEEDLYRDYLEIGGLRPTLEDILSKYCFAKEQLLKSSDFEVLRNKKEELDKIPRRELLRKSLDEFLGTSLKGITLSDVEAAREEESTQKNTQGKEIREGEKKW